LTSALFFLKNVSNFIYQCKGQLGRNPENLCQSDMPVMNRSTSGQVPKGLKEAKNPTFKVGSKLLSKLTICLEE
jgi:hypothetical protein